MQAELMSTELYNLDVFLETGTKGNDPVEAKAYISFTTEVDKLKDIYGKPYIDAEEAFMERISISAHRFGEKFFAVEQAFLEEIAKSIAKYVLITESLTPKRFVQGKGKSTW